MQFEVPLVTLPQEGPDPLTYRRAIDRAVQQADEPFDCAVVRRIPMNSITRWLVSCSKRQSTAARETLCHEERSMRELIRLVDERALVGMVEFHKRWDSIQSLSA